MNFKNSLSYLIENQLPSYIRQEYPQFVLFLEKYYEFLDQETQANGLLLNAASWSDINETLDVFVPKFSEQFLQMFPTNTLVTDRLLVKFIREFYEAKGSEKSIEFLFRTFFNEKPEIIYPSKYMLRASDGVWLREQIIRIQTNGLTTGNPFELAGKYIKVYSPKTLFGVNTFDTHDLRVISISKLAYSTKPTYELVVERLDQDTITLPGSGASGQPLIVDGEIVAVTADPADRSYVFDPGANSTAYVASTDDDPGDYFAEDYMTTIGSSVGLRYGRIFVEDHGLETGDIVVYDPGYGNEPIGGLISYRHYYVKKIDKDYFRLYMDDVSLNRITPKTFFSSSAVNVADDTITIPNHGFLTGDLVIYQNPVDPVVGLEDRTSYYVIKIDDNTIKLAETLLDADPRYAEEGYFANKETEEDADDSQPYMGISLYSNVNITGTGSSDYNILSKEYFINFTGVGTGSEHRFIDALDSNGSGYFAAPTVNFVGDNDASGAQARAVLDGNGGIKYVTMIAGGENYNTEDTNVEFDTTDIETYVYLETDPTVKYGYLTRGISSVSVIETTGTPNYGFKVNEVYDIIESGIAGTYVYSYRDTSLNYFAGDYVKTGVDNKASIQITSVDADGAPTAVTVFSSGSGFENQVIDVNITSKTGNGVATLRIETGAITQRLGRNKDRRGMLSDVNKLQDNLYYQNYSYVIRSKIPSVNWMTMVKNTVHPAGMALFGELLIRNTISFGTFNIQRQPIHFYNLVSELLDTNEVVAVEFLKELADVATLSESHVADYYKPTSDSTSGAFDSSFTLVEKGETDTATTLHAETFDVGKSLADYGLTTTNTNIDVVKLLSDVASHSEDRTTMFEKYLDASSDSLIETPYMDPGQPAYFAEDYVANSDVILKAIDNAIYSMEKVIVENAIVGELYNVTYQKVITEVVSTSDTVVNQPVFTVPNDDPIVTDVFSGHTVKSVVDATSVGDDRIVFHGPVVNETNEVNENISIASNGGGAQSTLHLMENQSSSLAKQTVDTLGTSESGIINIQDYWAGDFHSGDYVGTNYSI
jgi:hypothetical protein